MTCGNSGMSNQDHIKAGAVLLHGLQLHAHSICTWGLVTAAALHVMGTYQMGRTQQ